MDELKPAFDLLGEVTETFVTISDEYEPISDCSDNVVITRSFSSVSHFEHDTKDVLDLYEKLTGKKMNLDEEEQTKDK